MPIGGGRGGGGGSGLAVGPAPNFFGDAAGDLSGLLRVGGPASDRATAEAFRDAYTSRGILQEGAWVARARARGKGNYTIYFMGGSYTGSTLPWGSGAAWSLPGGTQVEIRGTIHAVGANVSLVLEKSYSDGGVSYVGRLRAYLTTTTPLPVAHKSGDVVTMSIPKGSWLGSYRGSGLYVLLLYTASGGTRTQAQVFAARQWRDLASVVAPRGVAGDATDFSVIPAGHIPMISAAGQPVDSGLALNAGKLELVGVELALKSEIRTDSQIRALARAAVIPRTDAQITALARSAVSTRTVAQVQAIIGAMAGAGLSYDVGTQRISVTAPSIYSAPVLSALAITGQATSVSAGATLSGSVTFTATLLNVATAQGNLTLEQQATIGGIASGKTTLKSDITPDQSISVSVAITRVNLTTAGDRVLFTLSGQDTNGNSFSVTLTIMAVADHLYSYWGPVTASVASGIDYTEIQAQKTLVRSGDRTIPTYTGLRHIAILRPASWGALTAIVQGGGVGNVTAAYPRTADAVTIGSTKYDAYFSAYQYKGSLYSGIVLTVS